MSQQVATKQSQKSSKAHTRQRSSDHVFDPEEEDQEADFSPLGGQKIIKQHNNKIDDLF
jgi:hypothetical protein